MGKRRTASAHTAARWGRPAGAAGGSGAGRWGDGAGSWAGNSRGGHVPIGPPRPRFLLFGARVAGSRLSREIQKNQNPASQLWAILAVRIASKSSAPFVALGQHVTGTDSGGHQGRQAYGGRVDVSTMLLNQHG